MKKNNFIKFNNRYINLINILEIDINSEESEITLYYDATQEFKIKTIHFNVYEFYFFKNKIENYIDECNKTKIQKIITFIKRGVKKWQKNSN